MPVNDLAGSTVYGTRTVEQIYAGEGPIITDAAPAAAAITKYQVCALLPAGTITPFVSGTHTAAQLVVAMQPAASGAQCPYAHTGVFNHAALTWPSGTALDTYEERRAFCTGTLKVGHITPAV